MSISIKFKDDAYLDSSSVAHNKELLSEFLENEKSKLNKLSTYSTEETVVGTWEDGRPLYRKYIDIGNLASSNSKDVNLTTYGIDASEVQFMEVYKKDSSGIKTSINPVFVTMAGAVVCRTILYQEGSTNILRIANGTSQNLSTHTAYAILYYTK